MDNETRTPTLDEMFAGMPTGQQSARPKYTEYAQRFKSMAAAHKPRMIVPAILIVAVVLVFGGAGWYMVRTLDSVPAAPMSAVNAVQAAPQAEEYRPPIATLTFTPTPYAPPAATPQPPRHEVLVPAGLAVVYDNRWLCPRGPMVRPGAIDISQWLADVRTMDPMQRDRAFTIADNGCTIPPVPQGAPLYDYKYQ